MDPAFRCAGCGAETPPAALPFRCGAARAGDDLDHVLVRVDPPEGAGCLTAPSDAAAASNPFLRYRQCLTAHALARARGLSDGEFVELACVLDQSIARADGHGFHETPFAASGDLAARLGLEDSGELWVKDETGNVSGSHKARHLAGVMLYLLVAERVGLVTGRPPLAIASCGNAALAAAVVARAADWPLSVFVPPAAGPAVLARLSNLGARVTTCEREPGVAGDPCYLAFSHAVAEGAVPFCCQGSDNGLTIEGGKTIAWEMIAKRDGRSNDLAPVRPRPLDAVFVQVGGGALASALAEGFRDAQRDGIIERVPRLYAVQTAGGFPLVRAFDRLVAWIVSRWPAEDGEGPPNASPRDLALAIAKQPRLVDDAMAFARSHRSQFMWPWEEEPRSIAHGILDDETYDWAAVVEGMLRTGGRPLVTSEERLREANTAGRAATGIDADHTGTAGLAGLMEALEQEPSLRRSAVAVIFSGVRRD